MDNCQQYGTDAKGQKIKFPHHDRVAFHGSELRALDCAAGPPIPLTHRDVGVHMLHCCACCQAAHAAHAAHAADAAHAARDVLAEFQTHAITCVLKYFDNSTCYGMYY